MVTSFTELFLYFNQIGFTDVLLPFLLFFVIVYAVLEKSKLFGADSRKFNLIISLVFGFLAVIPHITGSYPGGYDPIRILNDFLPKYSLVLLVGLSVLIVIGLFGGGVGNWGGSIAGWFAVGAFGLVIYIFGTSAGWWRGRLIQDVSPAFRSTFVFVLIFFLVIWFITRDTRSPAEATGSKIMEGLGNFLKKP